MRFNIRLSKGVKVIVNVTTSSFDTNSQQNSSMVIRSEVFSNQMKEDNFVDILMDLRPSFIYL